MEKLVYPPIRETNTMTTHRWGGGGVVNCNFYTILMAISWKTWVRQMSPRLSGRILVTMT